MQKTKQISAEVGRVHPNPRSALQKGRASPRGVGPNVKVFQNSKKDRSNFPLPHPAAKNHMDQPYSEVVLQDSSHNLLNHCTFATNGINLCLSNTCNHKEPTIEPCSKECFYCARIDTVPKCPYLKYDSTCGIDLPNKINCREKGVIYMITCEHGKQYIGQTKNSARDRWSKHIYNLRTINDQNAKQSTLSNIPKVPLIQHFSNGKCDINQIKFTILARAKGPDKLNKLENFFIRLYNSAYPFGLNDDIPGFGKISKCSNNNSNAMPYFNFKAKRNNRSHGKLIKDDGKRKRSKRSIEKDLINFSMQKIGQLNKLNKRHLLNITKDRKLKEALAKICQKEENNQANKKKGIQHDPRNIYLTIPFLHPDLETIGINRILKAKAMLFPRLTNFNFVLVWKYSRTIGSYLKNQNIISRSLSMDELTKALSINDCCSNAPRKYIHCDTNHISTNDPSILGEELNHLLKNGQKYRPIPKFNKDTFVSTLNIAFTENTEKLVARTKIPRNIISDFISEVKNETISKVNQINARIQPAIIPKSIVKRAKEKFIITGIDKEGGGLSINCPNLYIQAVCKELSIEIKDSRPVISNESLFELINTNIQNILNSHSDITRKFNCSPNNPEFPHFYLLAKYHKYPKLKFRTIANCLNTSLSSVSLKLNQVLTHIDKHYCNIFNKYNTYRNMKTNWACKSTLEALERINKFENTKELYTFDFSAMYNNIDQNSIITAFNNILTQCFKKYPNYHLEISDFKCKYTAYKKNENCFTQQDIVYLIETLLKNSYMKFGPLIVRMKTGIFMGSAFGCLLASLTLSYFEHKAVKDPILMEKLNGKYIRYLDDILVQNDNDFLAKVPKIYEDTKLKLENDPNENGSLVNFLDLKIELNNSHMNIGVFDKTDKMNMKIFKFFPPNSCVPKSLIKNVLYSQFLRYFRICNNEADFIKVCQTTKTKIYNLGYKREIWQKSILKFINKNQSELSRKYSLSTTRNYELKLF